MWLEFTIHLSVMAQTIINMENYPMMLDFFELRAWSHVVHQTQTQHNNTKQLDNGLLSKKKRMQSNNSTFIVACQKLYSTKSECSL